MPSQAHGTTFVGSIQLYNVQLLGPKWAMP